MTDGRTSLQIGNDTGVCTASKTGRLRYNNVSDKWEYCDGSDPWLPFEQAGGMYCQPFNCYLDNNTPAGADASAGCFSGTKIRWSGVTDNGTYWSFTDPEVRIDTVWRAVAVGQESAATFCRDLGRPWHSHAENMGSAFDTSRAEAYTGAGDNMPQWYSMAGENNYAAASVSCLKVGGEDFCPFGGDSTEKIVFVTSQTWNGNLGGVSGADSKCQAAATAANVLGTFKAWLSDQSTTAAGTLSQATVPYKLITGLIIANNWADLVDGTIQNPIGRDEYGNSIGGQVWTSTRSNGTAGSVNDTCNNWASSSGASDSWLGSASATNAAWTGTTTTDNTCDIPRRLYCFEQ